MISNHYPLSFASRWNWLIVAIVLVVGAVIRHFYNVRHAGCRTPGGPGASRRRAWRLIVLAERGGPLARRARGGAARAGGDVRRGREHRAVRCSMCHAAEPLWAGMASPPKGVVLDTPELIRAQAREIHLQAARERCDAARQHHRARARGARHAGRLVPGGRAGGMMATRALRGRILSFTDDPAEVGEAASHRYLEDGIVLVEDGRIAALGDAAPMLTRLPEGTPVDDHAGHLILPGLIDPHIHLPQTQVIASHGTQLLDWLQKYTFVEEQRFADPAHAARIARFFLDELLRNGTTTAVVYGSVHAESADALFAEAERRGTRTIAGKVMMDRGAPAALLDTAESGYRESKALIERWHGREPPAVRDLAALCGDLERRPARGGGRPAGGAPRLLSPDPPLREPRRDRHRAPPLPVGDELHRRLRPLRAARPALAVRPLHPPGRSASGSACRPAARSPRSARPRTCSSAPACSISRRCATRTGRCAWRSRPTSAAAPATRCCGPRPRPTRWCSCAASSWSALEAFYAITLGNARALGLEAAIGTPRARHRGGHRGARRARDAGHGASHGDRRAISPRSCSCS